MIIWNKLFGSNFKSQMTQESRLFSSFVPYKMREGFAIVERQLLELSPAEDAMVKVSMLLKGSMKTTVAMIIEGACSKEALTDSVNYLSKSHPILRGKVVKKDGTASSNCASEYVVEIDENLKIPVKFYSSGTISISQAWEEIWSKQVEKTPLQLGSPIARVDVIDNAAVTTSTTTTASELPLVINILRFCGVNFTMLTPQLSFRANTHFVTGNPSRGWVTRSFNSWHQQQIEVKPASPAILALMALGAPLLKSLARGISRKGLFLNSFIV